MPFSIQKRHAASWRLAQGPINSDPNYMAANLIHSHDYCQNQRHQASILMELHKPRKQRTRIRLVPAPRKTRFAANYCINVSSNLARWK